MLVNLPARYAKIVALLVGLVIGIVTLIGVSASQAAYPPIVGHTIDLPPDGWTLTGDVATRANAASHCTEAWFVNTPLHTIILGVNPLSCNPVNWRGGAASTQVFLPAVYSPTVYTLRLAWPDRDGKGLHSPLRNRLAVIRLDDQVLWTKRTTQLSTFNDYYGVQHHPVLTTIVVTRSLTHTLSISVADRTAWDLSQIQLRASAYPDRTRGICYTPFRDCQSPSTALQPSIEDIKEDLFRLYHTGNAIRTYSATGVSGQIPYLAHAVGLPVFAGAWLDRVAPDTAEIQALIALANALPLKGVIVGNEFYLRHRTPAGISYLRQKIVDVRNGIPAGVPVTTAEIDNLMFNWPRPDSVQPTMNPEYKPILDAVDFIVVHIYPLWNKLPIGGAAAFTIQRYIAIKDLIARQYPGQNKHVIIGEVGWPSAGSPNGPAVPSLDNQRRYLREFLVLAEQHGAEFLYFDAFDELWKISEPGRVGQNWGYSYSDRAAKHDLNGVLLPGDYLPWHTIALPCVTKSTAVGSTAEAAVRRLHDRPRLAAEAVGAASTFTVYAEWPSEAGHFVPSGWMGDIRNIGLYECDRANPHGGDMAIRTWYTPTETLGWGGVYWQYPENNWGNIDDGIDLRGADRLSFWARSDAPNANVTFLVGGIGYPNGTDCAHPTQPYPDSICPKLSKNVLLSSAWTQYIFDLQQSPRPNLENVIGGFGWVTNRPVTLYLDDIVYEYD
jgi:exo-beta-1,3-glucanase (GH17 family)